MVTGVVLTDIFIQLAGPQNAEGVVSVVFGRQVYQTDDPGIQRHIQIMKDFGQGVEASNFTLYGAAVGEIMVKSLGERGTGPDPRQPDITAPRPSTTGAARPARCPST